MGLTEEIASITSKLGTLTEQVTEILRTGIHILSKVKKILQKKVKCLKHKCLRQKKIIKKLTKKQGKSATQVSVIIKTILELMGSSGQNSRFI
jgi:hypothetical protein